MQPPTQHLIVPNIVQAKVGCTHQRDVGQQGVQTLLGMTLHDAVALKEEKEEVKPMWRRSDTTRTEAFEQVHHNKRQTEITHLQLFCPWRENHAIVGMRRRRRNHRDWSVWRSERSSGRRHVTLHLTPINSAELVLEWSMHAQLTP